MTIEEIINKKNELKENILYITSLFETETKTHIKDIHLYSYGNNQKEVVFQINTGI